MYRLLFGFGDVWDGIKDAAGAVRDGLAGAADSVWKGLTWLVHRAFGIIEWFGSILGIRWKKKLRVKVLILQEDTNKPIASVGALDDVVDRAKKLFKDEANVRLIPPAGGSIVTIYPQPAPEYVLEVPCDAGAFGQIYTKVGRWFRRRCVGTAAGFFRYGAPATIFVVKDVQGGKRGCFPGVLTDYGYIDPEALSGSDGSLLTLAHELGHACDLRHRSNGSLMEDGRCRSAPSSSQSSSNSDTAVESSGHIPVNGRYSLTKRGLW
jgi:hypothetical protein